MKEKENCGCDTAPVVVIGRVTLEMTKHEVLAGMTEMFKCLADFSRLKIINALLLSEMCVHAISEAVEMSQPAVSHHLKQLRQMRLVKCRREGKSIYYTLNDYHIQLLFDLCKTHISESENK